jgi:hypothetical protein
LQFETSLDKYFTRPYLEKPFTKIELVEWPYSNSRTTLKKKKKDGN